MKSFLQFRRDTEKKLGRELYKKEIKFLYWVNKRYNQEQEVKQVN